MCIFAFLKLLPLYFQNRNSFFRCFFLFLLICNVVGQCRPPSYCWFLSPQHGNAPSCFFYFPLYFRFSSHTGHFSDFLPPRQFFFLFLNGMFFFPLTRNWTFPEHLRESLPPFVTGALRLLHHRGFNSFSCVFVISGGRGFIVRVFLVCLRCSDFLPPFFFFVLYP